MHPNTEAVSKQESSVCAVVVTFNRKTLLAECLTALHAQQRPPDAILVLDNASTDGTADMVRERFPDVDLLTLPENRGGAGGFAAGIEAAFEKGFAWIWALDDDAEPEPDVLGKLLQTGQAIRDNGAPGTMPLCLCPVILDAENRSIESWHHMTLDCFFRERWLRPGEKWEPLRDLDASAFVGPLFNRQGVEQLGFPLAEYFIWADDMEYTYRFSQKGRCVLVRDAGILHKDKPGGSRAPSRMYYRQRNYAHFILHRCPTFARDRRALRCRVFIGLLLLLKKSFTTTLSYLPGALKPSSPITLRQSLLPLRGFVHGLREKLGMTVQP